MDGKRLLDLNRQGSLLAILTDEDVKDSKSNIKRRMGSSNELQGLEEGEYLVWLGHMVGGSLGKAAGQDQDRDCSLVLSIDEATP